MPSESLSRRQREERASEELADALDAVSRPMAERVLGRAIELDHLAGEEAEAAANTIDYDALRDIALEVGISEASLKKALLEELNTEKDHNAKPIERITVPDDVRGGLVVTGAAEEVIRRLGEYLERVEGLAEDERLGTRTRWKTDRRAMDSWTITQRPGDRQLVELDIETRPARKKAWRWIIGLVVLGLLFGNFFGPLVFLAIWVFGTIAVVGWLRRLARRARRSINRALGALTGGDGEPPDDWLTVWERSRR